MEEISFLEYSMPFSASVENRLIRSFNIVITLVVYFFSILTGAGIAAFSFLGESTFLVLCPRAFGPTFTKPGGSFVRARLNEIVFVDLRICTLMAEIKNRRKPSKISRCSWYSIGTGQLPSYSSAPFSKSCAGGRQLSVSSYIPSADYELLKYI